MKKVLSTVAAFGLVAGMASTAAALDFTVSGDYEVEGYYLDSGTTESNTDGGFDLTEASGEDNAPDALWVHTFNLNTAMKVNDKITVRAKIRAIDEAVWGTSAEINEGETDLDLHHLCMDYMSPIGKIRVGRVPAGPYGTDFLDIDTRANRVMWWPIWIPKPWSVLVFTQKSSEQDSSTQVRSINIVDSNADGDLDLSGVSTTTQSNISDEDRDLYDFRLYHKTESHDSGIRYVYDNNATSHTSKIEGHTLHLYGKYKIQNYWFNTEFRYAFGEQDFDSAALTDIDIDAWGLFVDLGGKFGNLSVGGSYVFASGDDNSGDDEDNSLMGGSGLGTEFRPLYIATGKRADLWNGDLNSTDAVLREAGIHLFMLYADYDVTDRLGLHLAGAYLLADEEEQSNGAGGFTHGYAGRDDDFGWEIDAGAAYKLLDNLTYEAHFAYFDTGDFFESSAGAGDEEGVFQLSHHLTMTF